MLSIARRAFNHHQPSLIAQPQFPSSSSHSRIYHLSIEDHFPIGLKLILDQVSRARADRVTNIITIVHKSINASSSPILFPPINSHSNGCDSDCFLKFCGLCRKPLRSDKDVYMYRGDQGFCSVECRNRQIAKDEIQQESVRIKIAPSSSSPICAEDRTCCLLDDLRQRRRRKPQRSMYLD